MSMISGIQPRQALDSLREATGPVHSEFFETLQAAIKNATEANEQAHTTAKQALLGSDVDIPEAMIAMQKAELSLELAVQVRNKVVQAYDEITKLQF